VLTGVVLGIAAQQVLGNVFAGAVLLLAHPFGIGDHIRVRSGALGGQFDGVVRGMNLTYVTLRTDEGPLNVPNSGMLAAAVGPWKKAVVTPAAEPAAPDDGARELAPPRKTRRR
jgi:small-conductance mechanosensitive channel